MLNILKYFGAGLLLLAVAALLWLGNKNQPDPVWEATGRMMHESPLLLRDAGDSLVVLYEKFHHRKGDKAQLLKAIGEPFMPNMTFKKFKFFFENFSQKQFSIVASITGSGGTTVTNRIAKIMASKPENLIELSCAPQFDLLLHKKYVGEESEGGFKKGEMLLLWEKAHRNPEERYVMVVDNFAKVNPESFFGPLLWEKLDNPYFDLVLGGDTVTIPPNFYFIAVIHPGATAKVELNNEHFNRLGGLEQLNPEPNEMLTYWRDNTEELLNENGDANELKLLQDTAFLHRLLYFFTKTNGYIAEKYGHGYQLGQWNNIRKQYKFDGVEGMKHIFVNHVNALNPIRPFTENDFEDMDYTLKTNGLQPRTSFIAQQIQYLKDTGYFVEITMVGGTALLTAFFGWWFYRRREKVLREYGERTRTVFGEFEAHEIGPKIASQKLKAIKDEVDVLVLERKLNYTEALYFLAFIDDKLRSIEFTMQVTENFMSLVKTFLDDDVLTESEYQKLGTFLESMQHKMPKENYLRFREQLDDLYAKFGGAD